MLRLVINSGRSVIVWAISLAVGWQSFQPLQIVGFLIMSLGVLVFNDILLGECAFFKGNTTKLLLMTKTNHISKDQHCVLYFASVAA